MFSATMAPKIEKLAKQILNNPEQITLELSKPAERVSQEAFLVEEGYKTELITKLIKRYEAFRSIIIFTSTKKKVAEIVRGLKAGGLVAQGMSSIFPSQREKQTQDGPKQHKLPHEGTRRRVKRKS